MGFTQDRHPGYVESKYMSNMLYSRSLMSGVSPVTGILVMLIVSKSRIYL